MQFHNVISNHFNAYVDVNTVRQVDTPGDTALANPFTVNLDNGENVVRVRLAAKAGQPHGEVYDSYAFYYKVTTTPPAKPTGLLAAASYDNVQLIWTDPGDDSITGYQVLRGPDAANLAVLTNDTGSASASYTDNTVTAETTYLYAIRARNVGGLSPQSDAVPAITTAAPPDKPTGFTHGASYNNVLLLWTDPGDSSITGYRILRGAAADSLTVLVEDTVSTDTRYTDDTVEPETEYFYAIRSRNAQGLGPQSDTVSVRTQPAPPEPVEPVADMATAAGAPTISGTPMVGQTLTADTSGITDADGLTTPGWTYQWVRVSADLSENDISGATSQTYKLVTGDVGHKIKVVVSFTDDTSESESRPSEPFPEHKFVLEQSELVSNRDQGSRTHIGNGLSAIKAQGFRTGPHPHGYDISTAVLRFAGGNLPASRFSLTIYSSNAGGNAGDELYEFVDPSTISTGFQTFTAPEGFHLEPNTDYFLRLWGDGSSSLFPSLADTTKEDSDSAHGWTIADSHQSAIGESIFWSLINTRLVMELFGSETSGPGPAAESLTVTSTPTNPTNYLTGDTITFALRFDESAMASGDPELEFDIGGTKRRAAYDSAASSGGTVVFSYTVVSDDQDTDGIDIGFIADAIKLDTDDSIQDADSNAATYGSVKLSRQADHRVNAAPGIALIEVTSTPVAPRYYGPSEDINITVTFDTPVTVTGDPEFEFSLGNAGEARNVRAQYNAGLSTTTDVVFTYTVLPTDEDSNGIFLRDGTTSIKLDTDDSIQDANNKDAILTFRELSTQGSHKIDPRPRAASVEVTSTPTAGTDTYGAGEIIEFTVTFNQQVIVTGEPHYVFSLGNSGGTRDLTATYDAGRSSARALVFTYRVVSIDVDNNGIYLYAGNTSFVLETGETVRNKFGNDARTDYGGNVGQGDHKVDGSLTPTNTPPGGRPTISGTAEVGQTLTASTTGITDDDGLTTPGWTYQWIRVDKEGTETDIPSATSQTYTLVSGDEVLQFRVRVSFTDDGSASETLRSGVYPATRGPSAPETLSLSNDRGDVTLTWTPPTDTGSSAITRYQYRVSDDGGNTWSPDFTDVPDQNSDSDQADERSYTISSLTVGTEHTIEVRAHNATRPGASVSRTVTPATTPGRPQSVNATAGDQQVALTWSAPSSDGGSPITHYQYRVRDETDNVWLPGFATGLLTVPDSDADMDLSDELSIIVTGLTNGHVYKFSVRAHNDQGGGGVADATTVPFAPLELIVHPVATDSVINIEEKGRGFNITGQTAGVEGVAITVVIGASGNLTGTSDSGGSWLVAVPPNASYIAEGTLDMTVSATASGYEAPDVTRQVTVDLTKPTVQTATLNGVAITLTYSEPLRPTYIPPRTAYQVNVDGAPAPLAPSNPVTISGSAVIITLASAVSSTATVTLDYTVPTGIGERPIQDQSRNPADGFTGQPVTVITSVIIDTPTLETREDGTTDTFKVKLAGTPSANVSIALASSDTSEGTVSPTPLTFTSTNWDTDQTVTVTGVDDTDQDGDQSYEITFAVTSTDTDYNGITVPPVKVTNIDDEASNDATLSGLALTDAGNNAISLTPAFASEVLSYRAAVTNPVTQIKVNPTRNEPNATIQYLDGDNMELADADGTTTNVFDVNLAEGENVFKIKVTAEDTTTTKIYVVTVTRDVVKVLVSNFSASDTTFSAAGRRSGTADWTGAQAFTTGENAGGYLLSSVKLLLRTVAIGDVPYIRIHNDEQSRPGTLLAGLVNPSPLTQTTDTPLEYIFNAPPDTVLASRTTYWLLLDTSSGGFDYNRVATSAEDPGHDPEWSIADFRIARSADTAAWNQQSGVVKMTVSGSTRTGVDSTDATLSGLVIKEGSNNVPLEPAFEYGVRTYTAKVSMAATQIRVEPTRNDENATIQYLDSADAALTDADMSTPDVFDVNLADGDTVVKVKVTAEDTTTIKTYQVTVTRVDFLVSNVNSLVDETIYGVLPSRPQVAIQFMTGNYPHGYTIDTVRLRARATAGTTPRVSIHSDSSGEPGSRLRALDNLGAIPTSFAWIDFDTNDLGLDPETPYWIVLDRASGNHEFVFRTTQSTAEDAGTAAGWSIGDRLQETTSVGGPWNPVSGFPLIPRLTIKGEQVEPAMILTSDFTSIIRELHELTFTLTRTGSTAETAPVTLWLENETGSAVITSSPRNQNLTFGIGVDTLEFTVPLDWISAVTGAAGNFRASVEAGSEYDLSDAVTTIEVLFPTALMEISLDKTSYEVTEGDDLTFNVVFRVLEQIAAPNKEFSFGTLGSVLGTAESPGDYVIFRARPQVPAAAWSLVGNRYTATAALTLETLDDALYERPMGANERLDIDLERFFSLPTWATLEGPSAGLLAGSKRYPVTIIDDETLTLNAELSSPGLTSGASLRIDEDAGEDVTLTVTNSDLASDGNPVTLPPGVKLKITPDIPTNRGATETDDWTITPDEIDLDGTATITIIDDMLDEGPESVTFEVGFEDDEMFQAASVTLTINDDEYTGPVLQSAEINGAILTLEFSNTLDATSRPARASFTVKVDGTAVSLASSNPVSISGSTVTLRLRSAVPAGDTVTVSYTEPGANPIQDTNSLVAASFTDEPVSNDERIASIEAVKSPILEGEEEVQFRITLSREPPAGGVNVKVEIAPLVEYVYVNPVSVDNYRTHNIHIAQGQTEAILEILTTRDEIASNTKAVTATLLPNTGYTVGSNSEGTVLVNDPDQVNVRFADGCGQTITVGEGDGEASFDIVLDNPVAFNFALVITLINGLADSGNDYTGGIQILQFEHLQTRITVTVPILEDTQLENTEGFQVWILRNGLTPAILTPTCGKSNPHLTIEITDNDTANIVLDAPEEVIEGQPIKLGLGPRPNVFCPVQFPFTTTLTITGDTDALQDSPGTSVSLELSPCASPQNVHIENDDGTEAATVWKTIDDPGPRGDRQVTFTIEPLMSSDSRVSKLILDRTSATVTIQNKPNRQPTGRPTLSGTDQVGHTLTASTSGIDDQDGLTSPGYTYQWQRQVNGVYTDIEGANAMVYTLFPDDQGKRVRVVVTLTDDDNNIHTLESVPTGLVQAQTSVPAGKVKVSLDATAYVVEEGDTVQVTVTLAEAPQEGPVYIRFTLTPENGATRSEFRAWSSSSSDSLRFATGQTTDWIKIRADDDTLNDDGKTITLCLIDLPDPYATLAGLNCATINILDNDDPNSVQVSFDRGNYWASEDGNPAWPRISVHPVPDRQITIPITITRGGDLSAADHGAVTTRVTFGPGLYGVHGDGHLSDNRTYASFPIEIWAIDDRDDDDGEYLDLAFGPMPDAFVTKDTGYRLGGDSRAGFRRPADQSRVWFNDNEFTQVSVTDPPNPLGLSRRMKVTFADAELEAKEGQYEIGTVATVRVQLSRPRNKESAVVIPITVTRHGTTTAADYAGADIPSSITFLPGQTEYSFRVRAVNDDIDDDDEYLTLSFGTLPELVDSGDQASLRIDLVDDDDPPVQVFFEQANYEVTSVRTSGSGNTEYARLNVKVKLSAPPERFIDVGIVAESIQGNGDILFEHSAYIPRGPHDGAHFYEDDTEFRLGIYISAEGGFDADQTYRLGFDGMSYRMSAGSPATATITIQ